MNLILKLSISSVLMFASLQAFAGGKCAANDPGLSAFCSNLSEQGCGFAGAKCSWEKEDEKVVRVIVEQGKREKQCVAREGHEVHEGFCNNVGRINCKVHSLCTLE